VLNKQGQAVLITGEAGSGKTALLSAFARQALDIARRQGAHTLKFLAAISLVRPWLPVQPKAARQLLAEIYAWFSEGLDTPDLRAAAALLGKNGTRNKTGSRRCGGSSRAAPG